jgi:hypothetical protein
MVGMGRMMLGGCGWSMFDFSLCSHQVVRDSVISWYRLLQCKIVFDTNNYTIMYGRSTMVGESFLMELTHRTP